jgi:hypothetical protein
MREMMTLLLLSAVVACGQDKAAPPSPGSAAPSPPPAPPVAPAIDAAAPPAAGSAAESDGSDEVAQLVVASVGSKALGSQKIETSCVTVVLVPAGKWTVAAARLKDCGNKTARSIVWLYKRAEHGKWTEDYEGQPPRCWKGVPPDIAPAVAQATHIPSC